MFHMSVILGVCRQWAKHRARAMGTILSACYRSYTRLCLGLICSSLPTVTEDGWGWGKLSCIPSSARGLPWDLRENNLLALFCLSLHRL